MKILKGPVELLRQVRSLLILLVVVEIGNLILTGLPFLVAFLNDEKVEKVLAILTQAW